MNLRTIHPGPGGLPRALRGADALELLSEDALDLLSEIVDKKPSLVLSPMRPGYIRGIDFYRSSLFVPAFTEGLERFVGAHGRLPDLVEPKACIDHFFAMKYFGHIPMPPSPVDKLETHEFIPKERRETVARPRVVWRSDKAALPSDDAVPAGNYYLTASNGCSMLTRVRWPVPPDERRKLEELCQRWLNIIYGVSWGEWWYATTRQRVFMEEDVSPRLSSEVSFKIFVRQGEVKVIRAVDSKRRRECFFDAGLDRLAGLSEDCTPLDIELPANIEQMMAVASDVGQRFDVARIDLFHTPDLPLLGEITLCHTNATYNFVPAAFDEYVRRALFE